MQIDAIRSHSGEWERETFYESVIHKVDSNINFIDLKLNDEVWENSEILLEPNTDLGDERIVRSLIKTYHPSSNIKVTKSSIKIRTKKLL
jgi:hypothetical protein